MKVLIISDCDPRKEVRGGIGIYSYNLARFLNGRGVNVIFIGKKQNGAIIHKFERMNFLELNKNPDQSNYVFLRNLFKISKKINLEHDTIIHSQRPDWLAPFSNKPNKKVVTLHGSHAKNVYLKKGFIIGKLYSRLEKKGLEIADTIISVSNENAGHYKKAYKNYPGITKKIATIPVGINLSAFKNLDKIKSRKKYGFDKSDKIVIYIGRLEKEKNLKILISACHQSGAKLIIVGEGRMEKELKEFSRGLQSDTIFYGPIANRQVPEMLACGDVFGITSLYEGFPTAIIEAFAAGLPVISTNVGDAPSLVVDGKTGFIVNDENIAEKIKILLRDGAKYRKNCLNKSKKYSWDKIGEKLMRCYKLLV